MKTSDRFFENLPNTVIALGKFDALHLGHMKIISEMKKNAELKNLKTAIFTFDDTSDSAILSKDEKIEILQECGIDYLYFQKFDDEFKNTSAEDFFEKILLGRFNAKHIVAGDDWHFGKDKRGDAEMLSKMCKEKNVGFSIVDRLKKDGEIISSTLIRKCILNGNIDKANLLLGRLFSVEGTVAHGKALGKKLGFPTVNFEVKKGKIIPQNGVYATMVHYNGKKHLAMTNVGKNPTVDKNINVRTETHIFDFCEDVYGEKIKIEFLQKTRDEKKFSSVDKLISQLTSDKESIKNKFKNF